MIGRCVRSDDAEARLGQALARNAAAAGVTALIKQCRARPWWSATFEGVQLCLAVSATPVEAAGAWLEGLADADLPMLGHVAMPPAVDAVAAHDDRLVAQLTMLVLLDS